MPSIDQKPSCQVGIELLECEAVQGRVRPREMLQQAIPE